MSSLTPFDLDTFGLTDSFVRKFLVKKRFTFCFAFIGDGLYEYPVRLSLNPSSCLVFIVPLSCLLPGHLERAPARGYLLQHVENVLLIIL